jgi:glycerophosphoryl diester phosphodiesterase
MQSKDTFRGSRKPLVFAHRGGAGEAAESTEAGFRHAIDVGADVLEVDISVTSDGEIVVWHGPKLDNVYIGTRVLTGKPVSKVTWEQLSKAFVFDPIDPDARCEAADRRLLRLEDFVAVVQAIEQERGMAGDMPWNIEIKGGAGRWTKAFSKLFQTLDGQARQRRIVLVAAGVSAAMRLRQAAKRHAPHAAYGHNLAWQEQLAYRSWFRMGFWFRIAAFILGQFCAKPTPLAGRSVQTSHALVSELLVRRVHAHNGVVDAFLTPFFGMSSGVDRKTDAYLRAELERLMKAGVDGIMTDYPARVVPMVAQLHEALQSRPQGLSPQPRGLVARFSRWLGAELRRDHGVDRWGVATVVVALCLVLLQALLYVDGGLGIEDFLGLAQASLDSKPFSAWSRFGRLPFAWAYLLVDSALFVPMYAAFGFSLIARLRANCLSPKPSSPAWTVLAVPLLGLVAVDVIENGLGLMRLDSVIGSAAALTAGALGVFILARLQIVRQGLGIRWWKLIAIVLGLAVAALLLGSSSRDCLGAAPLARLGCWAHQAKVGLTGVVFTVSMLVGMAWLFGADRLWASEGPDEAAAASWRSRPQLRSAIGSVLIRSRYVILGIALAGGLTAGMDQSRDVLYAMAAWPFQGARDLPVDALLVLGSLLSLAAVGVATAALEYTCWLWIRSVCQMAPAGQASPCIDDDAHSSSLANTLAKQWARLLAFVPIVCFVALHARVLRDGVLAAGDGDVEARPLFTIFGMGITLIIFGVWLLVRHENDAERDTDGYHSSLSWYEWYRRVGLSGTGHDHDVPAKYRLLFGQLRMYWLPVLLAAGMLVCRAIDASPVMWGSQKDYVPSMALAVVLFSVALWLCLFGWLSVLEVRQAIPWVGLLVVAVGALGASGATDNQVIWSAIGGGRLTPEAVEELSRFAALRMLAFTTLLVALILALYGLGILIARRRIQRPCRPRRRVWPLLLTGAALLSSVWPLLAIADIAATSRPLAKEGHVEPTRQRHDLQTALGRWLLGVCQQSQNGGCSAGGSVPVYFVSTEGGGIRAAVWTAFVLERMAADPMFLSRTFSISGVSGGAVGAAAFRACDLQARESRCARSREGCLTQFARTDLLSPLLSAWLFEDAVARVVPTSWCDTPGCGVLSRGAWFEQALEKAVPGFRRGLIETSGEEGGVHVPYLLLNATWVESGERAIASDLKITHTTFPAAKDQLAIAGASMPLGSAAHNAARFPYINAIGSVHATEERCADRKGGLMDHAEPADHSPEQKPCGHLADGGYLDNSGAQSTLDVVHGLDICLAHCGDLEFPSGCKSFTPTQCDWFRHSLVPQILMIRNDANFEGACAHTCPFERSQPELAALHSASSPEALCPNASDDGNHPERPTCRPVQKLYVGLVGPALTLLNVSGIRANGSLAAARQTDAVLTLRSHLGSAAASTQEPATRAIDLIPDGKLYPLGWHLSPMAITGMWKSSERFLPEGPARLRCTPRAGM